MAASTAFQRDALVERLFAAKLGLMDLAVIHIGERLGFYAALAKEPGLTSDTRAATRLPDGRSRPAVLDQPSPRDGGSRPDSPT